MVCPIKNSTLAYYGACQWIGFVGTISTGNHRFSHEDHGGFPWLIFSLEPIHWERYRKSLFFMVKTMVSGRKTIFFMVKTHGFPVDFPLNQSMGSMKMRSFRAQSDLWRPAPSRSSGADACGKAGGRARTGRPTGGWGSFTEKWGKDVDHERNRWENQQEKWEKLCCALKKPCFFKKPCCFCA